MRVAILIGLCMLGVPWEGAGAGDRAPIQPSFLIDLEPEEQALPPVWFLNPQLLPLWKQAITHPESEMQRQAAEAIARAHEYGHYGLKVFQPELLALLQDKGLHPATRFAAAHALIVLDCRDSASALFEAAQAEGQDLRHFVEPVLARWGFEPLQLVWRERVKQTATTRRDLLLAVNGLGQLRVTAAQPDLLKIALDLARPPDIRLAAARAAGETSEAGLEPTVKQILSRGSCSLVDRLCVAALLVRHRTPEAVEINQALAIDSEPAVAGIALRTLLATDPQLVLPVAEVSLKSSDANVRRVAIEAYLQLPTVERLETLSAKLNDPHPELRALVREGFFTHSRESAWETVIRESSIRVLNGDDWRGQEQTTLLLAALDRKEVAPRLVELLNSNRDEVMIATGWGLRVLAVPETAAALTEQIRRQSKLESWPFPGVEQQVSHLCEALGKFKYKPAVPVLRIYVPKTMQYGPTPRAAAVWALGQIFEDAAGGSPTAKSSSPISQAAELLGLKDQPEAELVEALAEQIMDRVRDTDGMPAEWAEVRRAGALALGRMKAASQLGGLKEKIGDRVDSESVDLAMRWAVLRISGEDLPIGPPELVERVGWFIEPAPTSLLDKPVAP